ncbi:MAG: hypothetical protein HYV93_10135 [Candidatus Rokubacteria bacterium]|nr:hypothetical protein [Candidatus Rokubacteria bacterium]
MPSDGATDVSLAPRLVLRFSAPARVETVTSETVTLSGPEGAVLSPTPGPAIHSGAADPAAQADTQAAGDAEDWEWKGERRDGRPYSRWQALPPFKAQAGVTALAGQVLRLNGEPLADVTLQMERGSGAGLVSARTDDTGRFLLADIKVGQRELLIDGRSASRPELTYGVFEVGGEDQRDRDEFHYDSVNPVQELSGAAVVTNLLTGPGAGKFFSRTDARGMRLGSLGGSPQNE